LRIASPGRPRPIGHGYSARRETSNLAAHEGHIAPAESVFIGSQFFGGPMRYVMAGSGHIAGVVNPPAKPKYQYWSGEKPSGNFADWVAKATETPGSWCWTGWPG
jgi:polyhydroxyalkanoate synthase subunit PhaC